MKTVIALLAGAVFVSSTGLAFAQEYPHAFPRPGATLLLENERVLVWEVVWPDGAPQVYHRHQYDMTGVFLRWGPLRVTRLDGSFAESLEPFEIPWVFFQRKGVTHKEEGIGQPERHSIMIDLKDYTPPDLEPRTDIRTLPFAGTEEVLDNPRVSVWSVDMQLGQTVPMHYHDRDAIWVFLEGGTLLATGEDGQQERTTWAYKDVRFLPRGQAHRLDVLEGSPRIMLYELE
jgi:quercetin dioxygenase-like cupin family protein